MDPSAMAFGKPSSYMFVTFIPSAPGRRICDKTLVNRRVHPTLRDRAFRANRDSVNRLQRRHVSAANRPSRRAIGKTFYDAAIWR